MKRLFMSSLLTLFAGSMAVQAQSINSNKGGRMDFSRWRSKSSMGFTLSHSYREHNLGGHMWTSFATGFAEDFLEGEVAPFRDSRVPPYCIDIKNRHHVIRFQPDLWILLFLNVYGIGGKVYTKIKSTYGFEVPDNLHLSFPSKNSYDGWEYGFGVRSEYLFKGFMPRFNYSMYWTDFDGAGREN